MGNGFELEEGWIREEREVYWCLGEASCDGRVGDDGADILTEQRLLRMDLTFENVSGRKSKLRGTRPIRDQPVTRSRFD